MARCGNEAIQVLLRQAARYAIAAEQDINPLIAVLHADYAAGMVYAIQAAWPEWQFREATGLPFRVVLDEVVRIQDAAHRKMAAACPAVVPGGGVLERLARGGGARV